MSKKIYGIVLPGKTDVISRLKAYLSAEETGIVLTVKEETILRRICFANGLLSERKYSSEQVAERIREFFGVSIHTARNDINNTYTLFSRVTEDYKRYAMKLHIEFIDKKINDWQFDKSLAPLLPKLIDAKTKALANLPVEISAPNIPQPVIIMSHPGQAANPDELEQMLKQADDMIDKEKEHEYLEFEDKPETEDGREEE